MHEYRIGDAAAKVGLSPDTLRYYERIGLLPKVGRNGGARFYNDLDLSRLRFIQRAQKMNFSLAEIAALLRMRDSPQTARKEVRELTAHKLGDVETRLRDLDTLRKELRLLVNLCGRTRRVAPSFEASTTHDPAGQRPALQTPGAAPAITVSLRSSRFSVGAGHGRDIVCRTKQDHNGPE